MSSFLIKEKQKKHLMTVHKFSKATVESQLKTNPDSYKNAFEKLKE